MYYCVHADVIQLYLFHNGTIRQPPIQCFILLTFLKSRLLEKSLHMTDDFNSFLSVNPSLYYSSCSNMYYPRYKLPVVLSNRQWQSEIQGLGNPIRLNRIWSEKIEKLGPFRSDRSVGGLLHIYIMVFVCKYNSEATKPSKCHTIIELCPPQHHNNYRKIIIHPKSEIIH